MRKLMLICASVLVTAEAQTQHLPRGTAVDISNAEVLATVQKTGSTPVSDQAIRVVSIGLDVAVCILRANLERILTRAGDVPVVTPGRPNHRNR